MVFFSDLSDEQIIDGLRRHDENITRDYFYGYCRIAYYYLDKTYHLVGQEGLDFYSLAHEYYLYLVLKNWTPLERRKGSTKLSSWMANGFRYIMLDRMKAIGNHMHESLEQRLMQRTRDDIFLLEEQTMGYSDIIDEMCRALDIRAVDRQILIALLQDGYKSKEIAAQLGISASAVSQRYHKMLNEKIIPFLKHGEQRRHRVTTKNIIALEPDFEPIPRMHEFDNSAVFDGAMLSLSESPMEVPSAPSLSSRHSSMYMRRTASNIYVFESNLLGIPISSSAIEAIRNHGAVEGQVSGPHGNSYAIPTMQGDVETIAPYVELFTRYAFDNRDSMFTISNIGAGSGFDTYEIAPLFEEALRLDNVMMNDETMYSLR